MPNHIAVNPFDHKSTCVSTERSAAKGDSVMCSVTFPTEFRRLQNDYPILFRLDAARENFNCLALFGFENGENLYLSNEGWAANYIPLTMAVQPFLIGLGGDVKTEKKVVIDMDSPRVGTKDGERLFTDLGTATDYLNSVSKQLGELDEGFKATKDYVALLQKYELLEPISIDIRLNSGVKNRLVGFHTINEDKLRDLSGAALKDMADNQALMPSFMLLASLSNLTKLIDRKNALDERA